MFSLPLIIPQDVQILVSHASPLRSGLPYSFLTPDLNFVPEIQRQAPGGIPSHLRVAKVYYKQDIETIVTEFESAKSFGDGAAEEWRKGLPMKGKEAMADAARWEKWEAQMRLGSDLAQVLREYDLSSFPNHLEEVHRRSTGSIGTQPAAISNGKQRFSNVVRAVRCFCEFIHFTFVSSTFVRFATLCCPEKVRLPFRTTP